MGWTHATTGYGDAVVQTASGLISNEWGYVDDNAGQHMMNPEGGVLDIPDNSPTHGVIARRVFS
jgi:hypothetical protein